MEKRTALSTCTVTADGHVEVRFEKQFVDGDRVVGHPTAKWHRIMLPAGFDVDAAKEATNADLCRRELAAVSDADWDTIRAICEAAWTPQVVAAYEKVKRSNEPAVKE